MPYSSNRRKLLKAGFRYGVFLPLLGHQLLSCTTEVAEETEAPAVPTKLKILILGGTSFLGPHQVAYALARGHSVSTFTRGKTKPTVHAELFGQVEQLIGDREDDLTALENGRWDVVIDNSGRKVEWTKRSAELLQDKADLYLYTSSTGVYYPYLGDDIKEDTELVTETPAGIEDEMLKMEYDYGVMKTNSERATIAAFGADRSIIVRPTYMIGPADKTNRFIHWPIRLSRGGEVLVPGPADPVQYADVRDVAEFMIRLAEDKVTGTFNAVGPKDQQSMREFVTEAAKAFDVPATFVYVDDVKFLEEQGIYYLVPWVPAVGSNYGSSRVSNTKAIAAGLSFRNVATSVKDTYDWWNSAAIPEEKRTAYEEDPKSALLRETAILADWKASVG